MDTETRLSKPLRKSWLALELSPFIALSLTGAAAMVALLPIGASRFDMSTYFVPWMTAVQNGGLGSLSGEFAGYPPPSFTSCTG